MLGVKHVGVCSVWGTLIHSCNHGTHLPGHGLRARREPERDDSISIVFEWMMSITVAWNNVLLNVFYDRKPKTLDLISFGFGILDSNMKSVTWPCLSRFIPHLCSLVSSQNSPQVTVKNFLLEANHQIESTCSAGTIQFWHKRYMYCICKYIVSVSAIYIYI